MQGGDRRLLGGNIAYRPCVLCEAIGDSIARITDTYDCIVEGFGVLFGNYHPRLFEHLGGKLLQRGNYTSVCALCLVSPGNLFIG